MRAITPAASGRTQSGGARRDTGQPARISLQWPRALIPVEIERVDAAVSSLCAGLLDRATRDGIGARGFTRADEVPLETPGEVLLVRASAMAMSPTRTWPVDWDFTTELEPDDRAALARLLGFLRERLITACRDGMASDGACVSADEPARRARLFTTAYARPVDVA